MKYLVLYALIFVLIFRLVSLVSAHTAGQPSFFRVNGVYSAYYPVPTSSSPEFKLPQDIAPENYLVNESINFEIDSSLLPMPKAVVDKAEFSWDFGDGTKKAGLKNTHAYSKPGTYFLDISAKYNEGKPSSLNEGKPSSLNEDVTGEPQLIQSMIINIVPSKDFKLPKAVLLINGRQSKDPLTDTLQAKFNQEFEFDGAMSESDAPITEYIWDFGDGQLSAGAKISHKYTTNPYTVFPVLRIKTSDGFIADAFAQIVDESSFDAVAAKNKYSGGNILIWGYLALITIGIILSFFILWRKTKKKKGSKA
jgi:hypothetical protein